MAHKRTTFYEVSKRIFDLVFSVLVLVVGAIPFIIVALLIIFETHASPIFSQERVGRGGKLFRIYKMRTMVKDSNNVEKYFTAQQLEVWKREYKVENDPRITRVGNFLRVTSLDEMPQFLNVLIGDLSVIGPRPITEHELRHFGDDVDELLSVKPGITGWWQATERNEATYKNGRRQELEMYYVRNASFSLDFKVFIKTFGAIFGTTGK